MYNSEMGMEIAIKNIEWKTINVSNTSGNSAALTNTKSTVGTSTVPRLGSGVPGSTAVSFALRARNLNAGPRSAIRTGIISSRPRPFISPFFQVFSSVRYF